MRDINEIIVHCSATPEGRDIDADTIRRWHVEGRGWSDIGYHFVVLLDGTVEAGRPLERAGAHVKGRNRNSIGLCYVGGVGRDGKAAKDTMNRAQEQSMLNLITALRAVYGDVPVTGHNKYAAKACPSFQVDEKWPDING